MEDHRSAHRRRTLKEGRILLSEWSGIDCCIRDLSETGARLDFDGPTSLPPAFRLLIIASNLIVPAELAWQRGQSAGVHFTGPGTEAPTRKT